MGFTVHLATELAPPSRPSPLPTAPGGEGSKMLSDVARAGATSRGRAEYRQAALLALRGALPFSFGFFAVPPGPRATVSALDATPSLLRLLTRHARASWSELGGLRSRATGGVLHLGARDGVSPLLRLLQLDRPGSTLCIGWLGDDGTGVVLGREREPGFRRSEVELLRLALPVLALADASASDLCDSLGAPLSGREREIFEYLQRGYSNRQIALVLGTSPLTVRNQLGRLFRKVGVASRSELVGLAAAPWMRAGRSG